jgi:hypothetical protein
MRSDVIVKPHKVGRLGTPTQQKRGDRGVKKKKTPSNKSTHKPTHNARTDDDDDTCPNVRRVRSETLTAMPERTLAAGITTTTTTDDAQRLAHVCAGLNARITGFLAAAGVTERQRRAQEQTRVTLGVLAEALGRYRFVFGLFCCVVSPGVCVCVFVMSGLGVGREREREREMGWGKLTVLVAGARGGGTQTALRSSRFRIMAGRTVLFFLCSSSSRWIAGLAGRTSISHRPRASYLPCSSRSISSPHTLL